MIIKCLPTGMFDSNSYIIGQNGEGVIIDVGVDAEEICEAVEEAGLKIKKIILTHGHIDHICSLDELREKLAVKALVHEEDAEFLTNAHFNGSALFGQSKTFKEADEFLRDKDVLEAGGLKLEIIHTPGHSAGSICIKAERSVFTGDTLFKMGIGRTDLLKGNYEAIADSLKSKLMCLDDDIVVYPGHGEPTTIGFERKYNPVFRHMR